MNELYAKTIYFNFPSKMVSLSTRVEVTKPVKLGCCLGAVFLIWILYSFKDIPEPDIPRDPVMPVPALLTTKTPDPVLRVDVYYECLCPDSKYFVLNHLLPAVEKIGSLMDVRLWPYGKAETRVTESGLTFDCQHGPVECEGNMYHACAESHIRGRAVEMAACMIQDNMDPEAAARTCAQRLGVENIDRIQHCATSSEGLKLHKKAGEKTEGLSPPVTFIPTIEIDGAQHSQKAILKNFMKEVCRLYAEKHLEPGQKLARCRDAL